MSVVKVHIVPRCFVCKADVNIARGDRSGMGYTCIPCQKLTFLYVATL